VLNSLPPCIAAPPNCRYRGDEPGLSKQYPKQDKTYGAEEYDHQQYKAPEYRHDKSYSNIPAEEHYPKQYKEDPKKKYKKQYAEEIPEKQYTEEGYDKAYDSKGPKEEQYYKTSDKHSYHGKHRQQYKHKANSPSEESHKQYKAYSPSDDSYEQYTPPKDKHYGKYKPSGPEYKRHEDAYDRYRDDRYEGESDYGCVKHEGSSPHVVLLFRGTLTLPEWGLGEHVSRRLCALRTGQTSCWLCAHVAS
jgi:hypothetical protein